MLDGVLIQPPLVFGAARLATMAAQGHPLDRILKMIGPWPGLVSRHRAAWLLDRSLAHALCFQPEAAAVLQAEALSLAQVFRVRGGGRGGGPTLLALMAPGDLMVNTPLDFLLAATDVQLTLCYVDPDSPLPDRLPDHDVALVAASEVAPAVLDRLQARFDDWPQPILNHPERIRRLSRDGVARRLHGLPGLAAAATVQATRQAVAVHRSFPVLLRPVGSHGGNGLVKCDTPADVAGFLATHSDDAFYLMPFIDYRGAEGWYRKYRVAFVEGRPFLCHMAASDHWMVHYLSAGMAENAAKRAAEATAMAEFDTGFAMRHQPGLAALAEAVGLDYFSIDCTEAPDGSLLVFEVDVAAIVHFMDPPSLYPYKQAPMQRCADAFAAMLARRC